VGAGLAELGNGERFDELARGVEEIGGVAAFDEGIGTLRIGEDEQGNGEVIGVVEGGIAENGGDGFDGPEHADG
jgi:hypothetical protein